MAPFCANEEPDMWWTRSWAHTDPVYFDSGRAPPVLRPEPHPLGSDAYSTHDSAAFKNQSGVIWSSSPRGPIRGLRPLPAPLEPLRPSNPNDGRNLPADGVALSRSGSPPSTRCIGTWHALSPPAAGERSIHDRRAAPASRLPSARRRPPRGRSSPASRLSGTGSLPGAHPGTCPATAFPVGARGPRRAHEDRRGLQTPRSTGRRRRRGGDRRRRGPASARGPRARSPPGARPAGAAGRAARRRSGWASAPAA